MAFRKARALQEAERSVAQGKTAQAIRQYLGILEDDPSDLSLLNTLGDLYIRERNITEGLRHFHRLAEAYVREGFNVKAIAIYRKITKVDPNSVGTFLKLGELYQLQGLSREAREQYIQAAEFFKKRNQTEQLLDVLRKLVQLDPGNSNLRNRLATEYEQAGRRGEAAAVYLEAAEIVLRRDDQAAAEVALRKAAELDPRSSKVQILRAQVALARGQPAEAEEIIAASPDLQLDHAAKRILFDAYLSGGKLREAEDLVLEVFRAQPTDFAPISMVSALMVEKGEIEEAYNLLASVTDQLINQNNAAPLVEALRRVWARDPHHIPTLELVYRVCERTADELTLPEALEALGRAHEEAGDLEKAEGAYHKLCEREPENEHYRGLLQSVQQRLGKEPKPLDLPTSELALAAQDELLPLPVAQDSEQEMLVREAIENSDLFSRYNLIEKAFGELEKVLEIYPDQIEVYLRILEISRKGFPERGATAAAQLARIFSERGETETAAKYQAIAAANAASHENTLVAQPAGEKGEEPTPTAGSLEKTEAGMTAEFQISAISEDADGTVPEAPLPEPFPLELATPVVAAAPSPMPTPPAASELGGQTMELDLSGDLEVMSVVDFEAPAHPATEPVASLPVEPPASVEPPPPPEATPLPKMAEEATASDQTSTATPEAPPESTAPPGPDELEDSRVEIEFYLENGFVEEARRTLDALGEKYPFSPLVAELRGRLGASLAEALPAAPLGALPPAEELSTSKPELDTATEGRLAAPSAEVVEAEPESVAPQPSPPTGEALDAEDWGPSPDYSTKVGGDLDPVIAPPAMTSEAKPAVSEHASTPAQEPEVVQPAAAENGDQGLLGDLAGELESSLEGMPLPAVSTASAAVTSTSATPVPANPHLGVPQLDGLLAEMEEPEAAAGSKDDPETHYNLGVAFREMGLLDESIGEFQKVVKGSGKGKYPLNFLQACSLLAICFMEKKMPHIAVKWYLRAMETPDLDEESIMALEYDLGTAYERAGDSRNALEHYTEVYSQNIDFRDVADKIRQLQQKA
jgi:tetratricopeptide (TPR) repeat protein